jgi:hypothetical protein
VVKEVLIKAVVQALPTYMMSVFKIPFGICDALEKHTRAFWWGGENGKQKTQWIPWEILVKPKSYGGLGFRDSGSLIRPSWRTKECGCSPTPIACVLGF